MLDWIRGTGVIPDRQVGPVIKEKFKGLPKQHWHRRVGLSLDELRYLAAASWNWKVISDRVDTGVYGRDSSTVYEFMSETDALLWLSGQKEAGEWLIIGPGANLKRYSVSTITKVQEVA